MEHAQPRTSPHPPPQAVLSAWWISSSTRRLPSPESPRSILTTPQATRDRKTTISTTSLRRTIPAPIMTICNAQTRNASTTITPMRSMWGLMRSWRLSKTSTGGLAAGTASLEMMPRRPKRRRSRREMRWISECIQSVNAFIIMALNYNLNFY